MKPIKIIGILVLLIIISLGFYFFKFRTNVLPSKLFPKQVTSKLSKLLSNNKNSNPFPLDNKNAHYYISLNHESFNFRMSPSARYILSYVINNNIISVKILENIPDNFPDWAEVKLQGGKFEKRNFKQMVQCFQAPCSPITIEETIFIPAKIDIISQEQIIDDVSKWSTYKSEKFAIKYPQGFLLKKDYCVSGGCRFVFSSVYPQFPGFILLSKNNQTETEFIDNKRFHLTDEIRFNKINFDKYIWTKVEYYKILQVDSNFVKTYDSLPHEISYIIEQDNVLYYINLDSNNYSLNLIEKILSTIEFNKN